MLIMKYILIVVFLVLSSYSQNDIKFYTENAGNDNHLDANGKLRGYSVEIVAEIQKRLKTSYPVEILPWSRAYNLLSSKELKVAVFSTTRTKKRNKLFKWVGPLGKYDTLLFARKDFKTPIKTLDDAKKVNSIGCYLDDVRTDLLIQEGFKNLDSISGINVNETNLKKLLAGRIELWICSRNSMYRAAKALKVSPDEIKDAFLVKRMYSYLTFSEAVPDSTVELWQKTLDEIKADKSYQKILMKYPHGEYSIALEDLTKW